MILHEAPIHGPAADSATRLRAQLPVLETDRLRLRAPVLEDFPVWAGILCGPAGDFLDGPYTRDEAFTEFSASMGTWLLRWHGPWTVETRAGDAIGFVLIGFEPGDREPELGFFFLPEAQGHGYALEAAKAARSYGFGPMGLPALVSYIDPENTRSRTLAERLGALRDGEVDGSEVWRHPGEAA